MPGVLLIALSLFAARLPGISLSALSRILLSGIPLTALSRFAARLPGILLVILARALSGLALLLLLDFLSVFFHHFLHRHRHENVRSTKTRLFDRTCGDDVGGAEEVAKRRKYQFNWYFQRFTALSIMRRLASQAATVTVFCA